MIDCDCAELFCRIPEATDVSSVTLKADVLFSADRIVFRKQTACWMYANNSKPTCLNRHLKFIWTFMKEPPRFLMLDLSDLQPPSAAGLIYQGDSFQSLNHHRLCGFLLFFYNFFCCCCSVLRHHRRFAATSTKSALNFHMHWRGAEKPQWFHCKPRSVSSHQTSPITTNCHRQHSGC